MKSAAQQPSGDELAQGRVIRIDNLVSIWSENSRIYFYVPLLFAVLFVWVYLAPAGNLLIRLDAEHLDLMTKGELLAIDAFLFLIAIQRSLRHFSGYTQITFTGGTMEIGEFSALGAWLLQEHVERIARGQFTKVMLERRGLSLSTADEGDKWLIAQDVPRTRAVELHHLIEDWMQAPPGQARPGSPPEPLGSRSGKVLSGRSSAWIAYACIGILWIGLAVYSWKWFQS